MRKGLAWVYGLLQLIEFLNTLLVNVLLGEESRLLHHSQQLLPAEILQLETVKNDLHVANVAVFVLRIPYHEKVKFQPGLGLGDGVVR